MSSSQNNTNNIALHTSRPQHQLHNSSLPLPGSRSHTTVQTQDYSSLQGCIYGIRMMLGTEVQTCIGVRVLMVTPPSPASEALGVQHMPQGGIGQPNWPKDHAGFSDGTTQKAGLM
ncbi:uncharacterized protein BJ212DRAFT_1299534 [Suillus subaureus]|uniref:Uncharacterized protein n=1 Tax=Suillus subaureus TaxID=48587 RepID=A0A9P7EBA4_9AGAM|nr:uncharacterized protein BJ212DRAFT_1299534 [Suillus subaureus]KAG1816793.1 hypothetical protein BJ212DRAFT_1299534 [Suillus subaureus]